LPKSDTYRIVDKRIRRVDSPDKSSGRAIYADDIRLPGTLFAKLKRSSIPHGTIKAIHTEKALTLDGVYKIITGEDLPVKYGILPVTQDETALAVDKVRYVGEPVAAVCAETEAIAQQAVELIDIEYSEIDSILSIEDAFKKNVALHESPKFDGNAHRIVTLEFGEVAGSLGASEYQREDTFYYSGSTHVPMESHSTVADYDGDRLTIHVSHQAPYYLKLILPKVLDIPSQSLRVIVPYVGGGFGGKLDPFPDTICAAKLSMMIGRPVKITLEREEVFYNHRGRHPSWMRITTGITDGRITAMHFRACLDGGAYGSFGTAAAYYHGALQPVTYRIPNYKVEVVRFYTNKPPCGPKRGHGTPQPRFALECHLDKIAEDIDADPYELRTANLIKPHTTTVNHMRVTTCRLQECMDRVIEESGFKARRDQLADGEGMGFAVGSYICGAGMSIWWNDMPQSEVLVKADRSGTITAYSGHTEIGQGSDTVLSYIIAECLGLEPEDVALVLRDSDSTPPDLGSYSSRVTLMMGNAARDAAMALRKVLAGAAALELDEDEDVLIFKDRYVMSSTDPEKRMTLEEVIAKAEAAHGALSFSGSYKPELKMGDYKGAGVGPSPAYSYAASVIKVKVDRDTGIITPVKVWIAHDIGRCINRKSVEGQVEGGIYMGLAENMMEEMAFSREGLLKNVGLLDYKTPTIMETPDIEIFLIEGDDEKGPFGAKEVGQGPILPVVPAFNNAVYDAIGIRFDEIPVTPDKVIKALDRGVTRFGPKKLIDFKFPDPVRAEVPEDATK